MKRLAACALAIVLLVGLAGCVSDGGKSSVGAGSSGTGGSASSSQPAKVDPYAPIPQVSDAPHEVAAFAALPKALQAATSQKSSQGNPMPAGVSDAKPTLFAYTLTARVGDSETLFEVRGDGRAYALHGYPAEPDATQLLYTGLTTGSGAAVAPPRGKMETAAASAVASVMAKAKPGQRVDVKMYGYRFVFIGADGQPVSTSTGQALEITIDPAGNLAAWT